jgi:putative PIN family toxin of toxin-antitoxin system
MKIVIDTNILVSAIFFGGLPRILFDLILEGKITAVVSEAIIQEMV